MSIKVFFWIIIIALIGVLVWSYFNAQVWADEDGIKSEIQNTQARIISLNEQIASQKIVMSDSEKSIKSAQEEVRKAKKLEGKSWDFLPSINAANKSVQDAVLVSTDAKKIWKSLLQERSNEIKKLKQLKKDLFSLQSVQDLGNYTQSDVKIIGITISTKCLTLLKANITTDCPTYKDLRKYDTSKQEVSGKFVSEPYYHRSAPTLKDSWRYYDHDPISRIIVDPPLGMSDRFTSIIIESGFDTYLQSESRVLKQNFVILNLTKTEDAWGRDTNFTGLNKTVNVLVSNGTSQTILYHDRYVDEKCKNAIINSEKWVTLLDDTIRYIQNHCTFTEFDNTEIVIKNYTIHDITTSQKFRDAQWKNSVSKNYKIGNDTSVNKSVTEDKMPKYRPKVHPPFEY